MSRFGFGVFNGEFRFISGFVGFPICRLRFLILVVFKRPVKIGDLFSNLLVMVFTSIILQHPVL